MKVLLIGATGNLGCRLILALLVHNHIVVAYVRSKDKLNSLIPTNVRDQLIVVEGDATNARAIKGAILDNSCDAVINTAGVAALPPWSTSDLPKIFGTVLDAVEGAGQEKKAALRCWFLGGMGVLQVPGTTSMLSNYIPIYLEHREDLRLLRLIPKDNVRWSMLCPSTMLPRISELSASTGVLPGKLVANATYPPQWQESWLRYIPLVGTWLEVVMNASRYDTMLEDNAEFIAQDLDNRESPWVEQIVGVIAESKIKSN